MLRRLTVLCENSVGKSVHAIGEHGFSCLIETETGSYLFDTGQGLGLLHNADLLNISLDELQGVILSHGHFDHTGGLQHLLSRTGTLPVYAHPELFRERFWVGKFEQRANGIPFSREQLESAGACFDLSTAFREIAPGLWLTGEIPRKSAGESKRPSTLPSSISIR
jgi:7,8-dihydropterin-6-yl-methyl-4-(beta-D-ribofuranosyl)aminobenzene 5'-phosphate synthase